jgi:hypothetical protein
LGRVERSSLFPVRTQRDTSNYKSGHLLDSCDTLKGALTGTKTKLKFRRGINMKVKFAAGLALTLCTAVLTLGADGSWTGYISDSACGAKGANDKHAECAAKCVKEKGAKYVFVNDADHKVYAIDAQDKVAAHAGHHVTVKGNVDGDNLKLASLEMAK